MFFVWHISMYFRKRSVYAIGLLVYLLQKIYNFSDILDSWRRFCPVKNTLLTEILNQTMQKTILKRYFLITVCKTALEKKFSTSSHFTSITTFLLSCGQLLSIYAEDINKSRLLEIIAILKIGTSYVWLVFWRSSLP